MSPLIDVQCPDCRHSSRIEYRLLGYGIACPGCQQTTVPAVPLGGSYPVRQWDLNFRDFATLVQDDGSRNHFEPLLASWFRYELQGTGSESQIVDSQGAPVDHLAVHLAIQEDPDKQYTLYQTAMSLWR